MSSAEAVTVIVSLSAFVLATVLALVWYLGGRIDRLDERLTGHIDRLDATVSWMAEDVAALKATR
jgi:hypothetical protein